MDGLPKIQKAAKPKVSNFSLKMYYHNNPAMPGTNVQVPSK